MERKSSARSLENRSKTENRVINKYELLLFFNSARESYSQSKKLQVVFFFYLRKQLKYEQRACRECAEFFSDLRKEKNKR